MSPDSACPPAEPLVNGCKSSGNGVYRNRIRSASGIARRAGEMYEFGLRRLNGGAVTAISPTGRANASRVFAPLLMRGNYLNPVLDAEGVLEWLC